jgi:radical SAM protein with 4Fe4S-binding SPASM domain
MVESLLNQAKEMGFDGEVALSFYNEPLLDHRIDMFGAYALSLGLKNVRLCTNADCLDAEVAKRLDGCLSAIKVALYDNRTDERMNTIRAMFTSTRVLFTSGLHRWTHYAAEATEQIEDVIDEPCHNVGNNMVIAHNGDVLACCDEIVPHFDIGNVYDSSLEDLWRVKRSLVRTLGRRGGRRKYPYCMACPRHRQAKAKYEVVSA